MHHVIVLHSFNDNVQLHDDKLQSQSYKREDVCQALTSSLKGYIMMSIMMGVLISLTDLTYQYVT